MELTTKKIDDANILVISRIEKNDLEEKINKSAKEAGKQLKVDGFRKGKVPTSVVKQMYAEKFGQDAEGEAVKEILDQAKKELKLAPDAILGQPTFKKFNKTDDGIEIEIELSFRPTFEPEGYAELTPSYEEPTVEDAEIEKRLEDLIQAQAPLEKIKEERGLQNDDTAILDFEGSIDGVPFDGGTAEAFTLKIGSGQFVPGFEDQMIGMNPKEEKVITVTFPEDYHSKNLAGKEAEFQIKLNEIQEKIIPELNDELASKMLQG
ncbi:MAG: trigger factor, partial [Epsilonproteobacteria bacterium]